MSAMDSRSALTKTTSVNHHGQLHFWRLGMGGSMVNQEESTMKMNSLWTIFAGFVAVGAIVGAAVPASAWSVRQNGAYCMTLPGANVSHGGAGVANHSTTGTGHLVCPVIDTSATPKTGVTALRRLILFRLPSSAVAARSSIRREMRLGARQARPSRFS